MQAQRSTKLALALAGGGFTGYLFEVGALTSLDDLLGESFTTNDFDMYVGVSAGSAVAALLAQGVAPQEILETNLSGKRPYYFEHRDIFRPAIGEGMKTIWRATKQLIPLVRLYARNYREMTLIDLLDKAQDALPSGIYRLEPFAKYLEKTFMAKGLGLRFADLRKDLYIPAIDLESGECVIFGEEGWRDIPIAQAVTASSAAPIYFCPVRIEGRDYVDAGIGRPAFFDLAIAKHVDLMVMINPMGRIPLSSSSWCGSAHAKRPSRLRDKGFLTIGEQSGRINLDARISQALTMFRQNYPDKELLMVTPGPHDALLFERSFLCYRDRVQLLRAGYLSVVTLVGEAYENIQVQFARHGITLDRSRFEARAASRMAQLDQIVVASTPLPRRGKGVAVGVDPSRAALHQAK
ncbi:MAG: patatin-like phospholipase family protein [Nitrospira sp.]|nr:patatin-like phospholipase family protein [Nitrospira sp.]